MMVFWIIVALMISAGVLLMMPALLNRKNISVEDNRKQNIIIARERMDELKKELADGTLTEETYQQTLAELEKSLLIDVADTDQVPVIDSGAFGKKSLISLLIIVPLLSIGLYEVLGSPQYMNVAGPGKPATSLSSSAAPGEVPSMEEMISGLQKKTSENPQDPNGWYLLGRLYAATDQFDLSVKAYEKLVEVSERQPTALVVLADSLAMTQDGSLTGQPMALIEEALEKDPTHTTALWMAGQAAADQKQYDRAIDYWQRAAGGLKNDNEMLGEIRGMIDEAVILAKQAGMNVPDITLPEPTETVSVTINISLTPDLLPQLQKDDVLFVFAREVTGPPMPLAAIKRAASELPLTLVLDDSSLLRPGTSLLDFKQLKITARISHSGQPLAQSGDLESQPILVSPASSPEIELKIETLHP